MNKKRKGFRIFEKVEHGPFALNITVDDNGTFHGAYGPDSKSGSLPDVRTWARETLRNVCALKWQPIMIVRFDAEDQRVNNLKNCTNLACYLERAWIAWTGKKWIECPWVVDRAGVTMCHGPANSDREQPEMEASELQAQRLARSNDWHNGPETPDIVWPIRREAFRDYEYSIPYTDEKWQTMIAVQNKIRELRARMNVLLSTQDGWEKLSGIAAAGLLPAPGESGGRNDRRK